MNIGKRAAQLPAAALVGLQRALTDHAPVAPTLHNCRFPRLDPWARGVRHTCKRCGRRWVSTVDDTGWRRVA